MNYLKINVSGFLCLVFTLISCQLATGEKPILPIEAVSLSYENNSQRNRLFDLDWKFIKSDVSNGQDVNLDDSEWRKLTLPHDWSIEDLPGQKKEEIVGPFSKESIGGSSTGHVVGGSAWYRKKFKFNSTDNDKLVTIKFDGVYMNSDVWINGMHLGNYPNGYTPFSYNLTPYLKAAGEENVIAVQVKNEGENSRWYTGSGIYRHVWLSVTDRLHVDTSNTQITTLQASKEQAVMEISSALINENSQNISGALKIAITDPFGNLVEYVPIEIVLPENELLYHTQEVKIPYPQLWSPENPSLYLLKLVLLKNGKPVDEVSITFGIRTLHFSAGKGFLLNGESYLMKGGCVHHDNGSLGSATYDRAEYKKVELLKANGFNAVRTSHNPPSTQFLDACDQLGLLVIDETFDAWEIPKKPQDYSLYFDKWWKNDIQNIVKRDRNHPSVVMWSIGNEIPERGDSTGIVWTKLLSDAVKELDVTRPVNEAICAFWKTPDRPWSDSKDAFELLDVAGYNYQWKQYESDHEDFPDRIMLGTESFASEALENWRMVEKYPWVIGDFVWTAMDYFGESGIGSAMIGQKPKPPLAWPWFNGYCGDIDIIGVKKPQSYFRDVVWGNSNIEMAVHSPIPDGQEEYISLWGWPDEHRSWSWSVPDGTMMQVNVYSSAEEVQLKLNGQLIGTKKVSDDTNLTALFEVPYKSGTLTALASSNGRVIDSITFKTTGKPYQIRLTPDREKITNDFNDFSYVSVEVVDRNGNVVPNATVPIRFKIEGSGELVSVANGNPTDIKSFQQPKVDSHNGKCMIVLRSNGNKENIKLIASAIGLVNGTTSIQIQ